MAIPWNVKIDAPDPEFTWRVIQRDYGEVLKNQWMIRDKLAFWMKDSAGKLLYPEGFKWQWQIDTIENNNYVMGIITVEERPTGVDAGEHGVQFGAFSPTFNHIWYSRAHAETKWRPLYYELMHWYQFVLGGRKIPVTPDVAEIGHGTKNDPLNVLKIWERTFWPGRDSDVR